MKYLLALCLLLISCSDTTYSKDEAAFRYSAFSSKCKTVADTLKDKNFHILLDEDSKVLICELATDYGSVVRLGRERLYEIAFYFEVMKK